jgi:GTP cyclohydrolase-4
MEYDIQTQDKEPEYQVYLTNVGIKNLKTFIKIKRDSKQYRFITDVEVVVDLKSHLKGVHMSRLVESVTEILTDETNDEAVSFEELNERVLKKLFHKLPYEKSHIIMRFEFAHETKTPISNRKSIEVYPIQIHTICNGNSNDIHYLTVKASGNTACPHALAVAEGKRTHVQRAISSLTVSGHREQIPKIEEMIEILESSFSSPTFSVLKTVDEAWVVERMFENPLFVEDVCRTLLNKADKAFPDKKINISAEVVSEESIHKHDVVARGSIKRIEI